MWTPGLAPPPDAVFSPAYAVPAALTENGIRRIADAFAASIAQGRPGRLPDHRSPWRPRLSAAFLPEPSCLTHPRRCLRRHRRPADGGADAGTGCHAFRMAGGQQSCRWFLRLSCSDWGEGGLDIAASVEIARRVKARGDIDLIDCSSDGGDPHQKLRAYPGCLLPR